MKDGRTFCWALWTDLALEVDGHLRPCCVYQDSLLEYQTPADLTASLENGHLRRIRETFLRGETPEACSICYDVESHGAPSKRMKIERRLKKEGFDVDRIPELESHDLQNLELNFSNSCNLACVTCSSVSSSSWRPLEADFERRTGQDRPQGLKPFDFPIEHVPSLVQISKGLQSVQLIGGEPLLSRSAREYLRRLSQENPDCDVSLTTNGVFFDSEIFEVLSAFRRGGVGFSIDGIGRVYEYIRGTSFSRVEKNIHRACELPPQIMISIYPTLSLYSAFGLPEMIRWVEGLQAVHPERKIRLILNQVVQWPVQMSVSLIPLEARQKLAEELRIFLGSPALNRGELDSLIAYLLNEDRSDDRELLRQAVASTDYFNEKRRFSIYDLENRLSFLKG